MKCPECKTIKLKVNKTINFDAPLTVRYYYCPRCNKIFGSTERLTKKDYSDNKSPEVEGNRSNNAQSM